MKWKPIETAPKDGREILVCGEADWWGWRYDVASWGDPGWECGFEPSHWKFLKPPKSLDESLKTM